VRASQVLEVASRHAGVVGGQRPAVRGGGGGHHRARRPALAVVRRRAPPVQPRAPRARPGRARLRRAPLHAHGHVLGRHPARARSRLRLALQRRPAPPAARLPLPRAGSLGGGRHRQPLPRRALGPRLGARRLSVRHVAGHEHRVIGRGLVGAFVVVVRPRRRVAVRTAPRGGEGEVVVPAAVRARAGVGERGRRRRDLLVQLVLRRRAAEGRGVAAAAARRPRRAVHLADAGVHLHDLDVLLHVLRDALPTKIPVQADGRYFSRCRERTDRLSRTWWCRKRGWCGELRRVGVVRGVRTGFSSSSIRIRAARALFCAATSACMQRRVWLAWRRTRWPRTSACSLTSPRSAHSAFLACIQARHVTSRSPRPDRPEVNATARTHRTHSDRRTHQVGSEDGLDLDGGGLFDADDGALGPRRGRREPDDGRGGMLGRHGRLGRGRGGDGHGDGVLVRVQHPRLQGPVVREAAALRVLGGRRRRAPEAPPPLLLGPGRGRRRRRGRPRPRPRQRQRQVRRVRRPALVPAAPPARQEAPEPLARPAHPAAAGSQALTSHHWPRRRSAAPARPHAAGIAGLQLQCRAGDAKRTRRMNPVASAEDSPLDGEARHVARRAAAGACGAVECSGGEPVDGTEYITASEGAMSMCDAALRAADHACNNYCLLGRASRSRLGPPAGSRQEEDPGGHARLGDGALVVRLQEEPCPRGARRHHLRSIPAGI
jgi:hypothetical protein